jgi:serine/threonine protein phosphatase PrpC
MLSSKVATLLDNSVHGEDAFLTRDLGNNAFLDVVMDGVTGHGGKEASSSLKEALADTPVNSPEDVVTVLEEMNAEFYQVGGGRFLLTTVSVVLHLNDRLHIIGAGDSPVFLVNENAIEQLSGRVGGFLHVGVARAIGAGPTLANLVRIETQVDPGSRLVLATDGLSDNMLTEVLADMVRGADSPDEAADRINRAVETYLQEGRMPEQLGQRFRHDDRTAIFRFFGTTE